MNIGDIGFGGSENFYSNLQTNGMNESDSEDENLQFNSSLDWQCLKSPYDSFLYAWGNTVDGELGLGGIEEDHILSPRQVTFHDSDNIKFGNYTI